MSRTLAAVTGLLLIATSCISRRTPAPVVTPPPVITTVELSPWVGASEQARRLVGEGRYVEADGVLRDFSVRYKGTSDGLEADFLRAMLRADSQFPVTAPGERTMLLDSYLALGPSTPHYAEARALRSVMLSADADRQVSDSARLAAEARVKSRDEEIRRLTDELMKANTELERIRRRLAPRAPTDTLGGRPIRP